MARNPTAICGSGSNYTHSTSSEACVLGTWHFRHVGVYSGKRGYKSESLTTYCRVKCRPKTFIVVPNFGKSGSFEFFWRSHDDCSNSNRDTKAQLLYKVAGLWDPPMKPNILDQGGKWQVPLFQVESCCSGNEIKSCTCSAWLADDCETDATFRLKLVNPLLEAMRLSCTCVNAMRQHQVNILSICQ